MRRLAVALTIVAVAGAAPAHAATDEDQVRAVLDGMNGAYNRADFDTFASHVCAEMRGGDGFEAGWHASRKTDGPTNITVYAINIEGALAVADVRFAAANRADARVMEVDFVRERAEWKVCRYAAGRTV